MTPSIDIEDLGISHLKQTNILRSNEKRTVKEFVKQFINRLENHESELTRNVWNTIFRKLTRIYEISPGIVQMNYAYRLLLDSGEIQRSFEFEKWCIAKTVRVNSGVVVITVLTSPYPENEKGEKQEFSCEYDCHYCPNEPAHEDNNWKPQPRSYLTQEPAVRRANRCDFNPIEQFDDRFTALTLNGHIVDKVEILILGGTWSSYPEYYRQKFCRDLFYAANTSFVDKKTRRTPFSLKVEQRINESSKVRIIGLTIETRPDQINSKELQFALMCGATRIQEGVQSTHDRILHKINRGCTDADTIRSIRNAKDSCFKVDVHLMPDLPGSTPELDREMIDTMLYDPDHQADQWKIYPCSTVPWSRIEYMHQMGQYEHYSEEELNEVLIYALSNIQEDKRVNRVIRDIPNSYIIAGNDKPNRRQIITEIMEERGIRCRDIRSREVKQNPEALAKMKDAILVVRSFEASQGSEYFISFESHDNEVLYGFCRLRLSKTPGITTDLLPKNHRKTKNDNNSHIVNAFPVLNGCALLRELHVYGNMNAVHTNKKNTTQHCGFGKRLLKEAENISKKHGYKKIAVISGVGVRNYYRKHGYSLKNGFMIKNFQPFYIVEIIVVLLFVLYIFVAGVLYSFQA